MKKDQDIFLEYMEIWKDIQGYEGIYQVSNYGRVKSLERRINWKNTTRLVKEKILNPLVSNDRLYVRLCNGEYIDLEIHRLVAQAFLPNTNNYEHVHHKDRNPRNNRVENLCWMDEGEHHALHNKEKSKTVYQYTLDGLLVNVWENAYEAARVLGFSQARVNLCCLGKGKTHKGFKWSYNYE